MDLNVKGPWGSSRTFWHKWLDSLWENNKTNNRNNVPGLKTITAAAIIKEWQLTRAATYTSDAKRTAWDTSLKWCKFVFVLWLFVRNSSDVYLFWLIFVALQQAYGWMGQAEISSGRERYSRAKRKHCWKWSRCGNKWMLPSFFAVTSHGHATLGIAL